jgi:ubiquitin-like 1-activating enzyme E1 A
MTTHASHYFPPTLAILGGLVAQDVLRCLSRKDTPIANLLAVDSMGGTGNAGGWVMGDMRDEE